MEQDATFREIRQASSAAEKRLAEQIRAELGSFPSAEVSATTEDGTWCRRRNTFSS